MFDNIPRSCRYGYARVSSKSQEENSSLKSQEQEFFKLGFRKKILESKWALRLLAFLSDLFSTI